MATTLGNLPYVLIGLFVGAMIMLAAVDLFDVPIPSAKAAPPDVPECAPINTFGLITIARCEPDEGLPYKINSLGFMLDEE